MSNTANTQNLLPCLVPGCEGSRRTRGICHPHYQNWRAQARAGTAATDEDLMARGLLLPKSDPTGGAGKVIPGKPFFSAGSVLKGDGARLPSPLLKVGPVNVAKGA